MAKYVDGFVIVMKKENLAAYKQMALEGAELWKKHGAIDYKECVQDDMNPPGVTLTFPKLTNAGPDEIVCFSYIVYESRAHRDEVNKKVMSDPYMAAQDPNKPMPFDMNKMAVGGFEVLVDGQ